MIRASCFAIGLFIVMWGASFLTIDRVVFKHVESAEEQKQKPLQSLFMSLNDENKREISCPDWGAFALMSMGSVAMLYSVALPRR